MNWISVEDRLPEETGYYLIFCHAGEKMFPKQKIDYFIENKQGWLHSSNITHWMPLPAPPKENNSASWTECENCGLIHDPKLTRCSLDILKENK